MYIPDNDEVKRLILRLYHDSILAGHPSQVNTVALVARNYYWPCMSEYVKCYVEGCEMCQCIKPQWWHPHGPLQLLMIPDGLWQHVLMDYIGPLPMLRGHDAIQVICDKSTKRAHFLGVHLTDDAVAMCNTFMEWVWCLHGMPKKVVSDQGPHFIVQYMKQMWERLGIKQALSTAHHP